MTITADYINERQRVLDTARQRFSVESAKGRDPAPRGVPISAQYRSEMSELERLYGDLRWLPMAIPKIEIEDKERFDHTWQQWGRDLLRIRPCNSEPWTEEQHPLGLLSSWHRPVWQGLTIWQNSKIDYKGVLTESDARGKNPEFARLVDQVFQYYPIHTMWRILIWSSVSAVLPHRDETAFWHCPTEFRTMLWDENPQPTMYVADCRDGGISYIDLPEDTNSFCWSNGSQVHGSDYLGNRKFILIAQGVQHSLRSRQLFEHSVDRYRSTLQRISQTDLGD